MKSQLRKQKLALHCWACKLCRIWHSFQQTTSSVKYFSNKITSSWSTYFVVASHLKRNFGPFEFVFVCFRYQTYWSDIHRSSEANAGKAQVWIQLLLFFIYQSINQSITLVVATSLLNSDVLGSEFQATSNICDVVGKFLLRNLVMQLFNLSHICKFRTCLQQLNDTYDIASTVLYIRNAWRCQSFTRIFTCYMNRSCHYNSQAVDHIKVTCSAQIAGLDTGFDRFLHSVNFHSVGKI